MIGDNIVHQLNWYLIVPFVRNRVKSWSLDVDQMEEKAQEMKYQTSTASAVLPTSSVNQFGEMPRTY